MQLPSSVTQALAMLKAGGHEAYVVGGCVRDRLRGAEPADWDIATSALPELPAAVWKQVSATAPLPSGSGKCRWKSPPIGWTVEDTTTVIPMRCTLPLPSVRIWRAGILPSTP